MSLVQEAAPAKGYDLQVAMTWPRGDEKVVTHKDVGYGLRITQPGKFPTEAAARTYAAGQLEKVAQLRYAILVRKFKRVPDRLDQLSRLKRYLAKNHAPGLLNSKLGRRQWPLLSSRA